MIGRGLFIVSALLICGCATTTIEPSPSISQSGEIRSPSIVGRWKLVSIDGISVASGKVILIFEADGSYRRQVSCNQGIGTYRVAGGILSLGPVGETERGCEPYENEALIDKAVRLGPWTLRADGYDALFLEGRHKLYLLRYNG